MVKHAERKSRKRELLSGAFVAVPANPNAVVLSAKSAKAIDDKQLDASGDNPPKPHAQTIHDVAVALGAQCNRTQARQPGVRRSNKSVGTVYVDVVPRISDKYDMKGAWGGDLNATLQTSNTTKECWRLQRIPPTIAATATAEKSAVAAAADAPADDVAKQKAAEGARALAFLISKNNTMED